MKKKKSVSHILSWILYVIGFIGFLAFLSAVRNVSEEAWLYAMGSNIGVALFCLSGYSLANLEVKY